MQSIKLCRKVQVYSPFSVMLSSFLGWCPIPPLVCSLAPIPQGSELNLCVWMALPHSQSGLFAEQQGVGERREEEGSLLSNPHRCNLKFTRMLEHLSGNWTRGLPVTVLFEGMLATQPSQPQILPENLPLLSSVHFCTSEFAITFWLNLIENVIENTTHFLRGISTEPHSELYYWDLQFFSSLDLYLSLWMGCA